MTTFPCAICAKSCPSGSVLTDGSRYHQECYDWLVRREAYVTSETLREKNAQSGLVAAVSRLFGLSSDSELTALRTEQRRLRRILWHLHSFWPDYPPDWYARRRRVLGAQPYCQGCLSDQRLQVHHSLPLSRAGSNELSNLVVLCEQCHSAEHGGRTLGARASHSNHIQRNLQLIQKAVVTKRKLRFTYTKYGRHGERRTVTPHRIVRYEHRRKVGYTLCLEGFCHKRNDTRVFKIAAITRMKVL